MKSTYRMTPLLVGIALAIGCGGGKPENASATPPDGSAPANTTPATGAERPMQIAQAPEAADPAGGSGDNTVTIDGIIRFTGTAPARAKVKMDADPVCQQQHPTGVESEDVVVNENGTLRNVAVYVKDGVVGAATQSTEPVVLDQQGCWYRPHVFTIQVNQPLEIVNDDPTLHNVNAKPTNNQPFNVAQPAKGMKTTKKFTRPEIGVKFKCNVHPWMSAYAVVTEHPYAGVSGDDGTFSITGLSPGTYTLEAWHEKYGTQTQSVTVEPGEAKTVEFSYKAQ